MTRERSRSLGPFSSTQLTIIIAVLAVVVGFPFGAGALTGGTNVVVTGPTGAAANVTSGALVTHVANPVQAVVNGTVTAEPATPSNMFFDASSLPAAGGCQSIATPPAGKALIVTDVHYNIETFQGTDPVHLFLRRGAATDPSGCGGSKKSVDEVSVNSLGGWETAIGSGLAVHAGNSILVSPVSLGNGVAVGRVFVYGYLVPAAACPALTCG